jgi:hypothetical protein
MSRIFKKKKRMCGNALAEDFVCHNAKNVAHETSCAPFVRKIKSQALWASAPTTQQNRKVLATDVSVLI